MLYTNKTWLTMTTVTKHSIEGHGMVVAGNLSMRESHSEQGFQTRRET